MAKSHTITTATGRRIASLFAAHSQEPRSEPGPPGPIYTAIPFQFRRFELASALVPSSYDQPTTALAWPLWWNTATVDYLAADGDVANQFIVVDLTGHRRGRAKADSSSAYAWNGARGWCIKPHDVDIATGGDCWEIVEMQWRAKVIDFTLTSSGFGASSATASVTYHDDGYDPDPDDDGITVYTTDGIFANAGGTGDKGKARYYPRRNKYECWQLECE